MPHHHTTPRRRRRLSACGEPLQSVTFSLPADVAEYIGRLGEGSHSAGLRELLRLYKRIPAELREQLLQRMVEEIAPHRAMRCEGD